MSDDRKHIDQETGTETTGHEWDGIRELNTPMPRWWLWTFYGTVVWSAVYVVLYPAIPLVNEATGGILGYSTRGEVAEAIEEAEAGQSAFVEQIAANDLTAIQDDAELLRFARQGGASVFRTYCSQCHGAGAAGVQASGYPNLLDDDWLWGGTVDAISQTVSYGIRADNDETRDSQMPAFGDDGILSGDEIAAVAEYVISMSGQDHDATLAEEGMTLYADNCAACHGEDGGGVTDLGAPALNDAIWLYGGDRETVIATITHSRAGMMPAWSGRLTDAEIKQVALYVHGLGGGEEGPQDNN